MPFEVAIGSNVRKSPYFEATVADGVKSFSVYNHMFAPASFGNTDAHYRALYEGVVMWDVACERQVELVGPDAESLMRYLTPRDISNTVVGQGKYVPLCDYNGILINDPVLLKLAEDRFWLSIADSDVLLWAQAIAAERGMDVRVFEPDVSPLGIQGPRADDLVAELFGDWVRDLRYFWFKDTDLDGIPIVLARSGWSKQGGFELYLQDGTRGTELYNRVKKAGAAYDVVPGSPSDMERIESGLLSYGADARYQVNPYEAGLGAFVELDRDDEFIGKAALRQIADDGVKRQRVGFVVGGERIDGTDEWHEVHLNYRVVGTITEAIFSPRLRKNIGVGMLATDIDFDADLTTNFGDGSRAVTACDLPFNTG